MSEKREQRLDGIVDPVRTMTVCLKAAENLASHFGPQRGAFMRHLIGLLLQDIDDSLRSDPERRTSAGEV